MKDIPSELQVRLNSGVTTLCQCWRITRNDGVVQGFTGHDEDIVMDGVTCRAGTGFAASEAKSALGLSVGGMWGAQLALEHPERVDRLVLMGPGGGTVPGATGPTEGIRQLQGYYLGEGPTLEKLTAFIGNLVYDSSLITPELIRQRFEASADPAICANPPIVPRPTPPGPETFISRDPRLASVAHRALFIWGQQDKVNPAAGIDSFKVMPNADYVLLNHCGHWAQWEHPERFNDLVLSFLRNP